jgi:hypothetical protein
MIVSDAAFPPRGGAFFMRRPAGRAHVFTRFPAVIVTGRPEARHAV